MDSSSVYCRALFFDMLWRNEQFTAVTGFLSVYFSGNQAENRTFVEQGWIGIGVMGQTLVSTQQSVSVLARGFFLLLFIYSLFFYNSYLTLIFITWKLLLIETRWSGMGHLAHSKLSESSLKSPGRCRHHNRIASWHARVDLTIITSRSTLHPTSTPYQNLFSFLKQWR